MTRATSPQRHIAPKRGPNRRPAKLGHSSSRPPDDGNAFLPDPRETGHARTRDNLAENLAEEFISSATSAEGNAEDVRDEFFSEEIGGPFVTANPDEEYATTTDDMNPAGASKEPFPRAIRAPKE